IVHAYKKELDKRDQDRRDVMVAELEKQKSKYQEQLDKKRSDLRKEELEKKIPDKETLQVQFTSANFRMTGVQKALGDTKDDLTTKQLLLDSKEARLEQVDRIPIAPFVLNKTLSERLQATGYPTMMATKDVQIAQLMAGFPDSPARQAS